MHHCLENATCEPSYKSIQMTWRVDMSYSNLYIYEQRSLYVTGLPANSCTWSSYAVQMYACLSYRSINLEINIPFQFHQLQVGIFIFIFTKPGHQGNKEHFCNIWFSLYEGYMQYLVYVLVLQSF